MKKPRMVLMMLVLAALLLAACGGEQTATSAPGTTEPTATVEPTGTSEMTTATVEGTVDGTTTPEIPVTGEESPSRLTNLMNYDVWNQNGEQIGDVNDMVLDFDNTGIAYVIVGTGGFLGLGEKDIPVPWNMLQLQTDGGTTGDQNVLLFTGNEEYYRNAPDFDINNLLPETGQPVEDWDADIESFWSTGTAPDTAAQTPEATAAATEAAVATATLAVDGQGQGGVTAGREMQGVVLASELIGSTIQAYGAAQGQADTQGQGTATISPDATAMPADAVTPTVDATGAGTTDAASMDAVALTVEDAIVDPDTGEFRYLVVSGGFADGERLLPVPPNQLRWDETAQSYSLGVNTTGLENAPAFEEGQYPDFATDGWDDEIASFWNNLEADFQVGTPAP